MPPIVARSGQGGSSARRCRCSRAAEERDALPLASELLHRPRRLGQAARLVRLGRLERGGHPRPASPLSSSGCGAYFPGLSPHRRGVGKTLPGFMRPSGSNEQRKSAMVARSSSENSSPYMGELFSDDDLATMALL